LIRPASSLSIALKNAEVDVTDEHFNRLVFITDGRQLQKSTNQNYREIAARWDGSRLVSDEKSPQGGKMSRTFELSRDGRQVYETINVDTGKSRRQMNVRYVYDIDSKNAQSSRDSDPDQPAMKRRSDNSNSSPQ
jgi:hypothetical protein